MQLSEDALSEGVFDYVEVYLQEPSEYVVFLAPVSEGSMKMWMTCLHPARRYAKIPPLRGVLLTPPQQSARKRWQLVQSVSRVQDQAVFSRVPQASGCTWHLVLFGVVPFSGIVLPIGRVRWRIEPCHRSSSELIAVDARRGCIVVLRRRRQPEEAPEQPPPHSVALAEKLDYKRGSCLGTKNALLFPENKASSSGSYAST